MGTGMLSLQMGAVENTIEQPRALYLAELLVEVVAFIGPGRIEIDVDESGNVQHLWRHERTKRDQLGRFDTQEGGS